MEQPVNILLVEDDEVDRLTVVRALRLAGLETVVEEAESVTAAADALTLRTFDCVLLDYRLPEGDALDVLKSVRQAGLDTPVIILTGRGDEQTAVELMKAGAADYLSKHALSPQRLLQSLRYATERQQHQRECDQLLVRADLARREAERANAAKDIFLATLSHELRTPMSSIMGWASMLRNHELDKERMAHGLAVIERNAKVQVQLINDLLDVSRIVSGKFELALGSVEPVEACESALETLRPQIEAKNIKIEKAFDPTRGPIKGDAGRLQQVIWNLLSNAIKFSPESSVIRLELRRFEATVEIAVIDHGSGIDPDFLPHIFERFSQASDGTAVSRSGLGLGLAIVRHIVELHDGTIRAESDGEGAGARFMVRLPAEPEPSIPASTRPVAEATRLDGIHVLFVDDSADARELVATILTAHGASVTIAQSIDTVLAALERERPDVLVSDIEMPGGDGYQMIRALRLREEDAAHRIPAIALTGTTRAEDRIRMLSEGFQLHVPKPIDPTELVAAVAALALPERGTRMKRDGPLAP
jgi:signal transduction histidine kinase